MSNRIKIIALGSIVILAVITIYLVFRSQFDGKQGIMAGQIALYPATLELGTGKVGDVKEGLFHLRNQSDSEVKFNIVTGCNCTRVEPRSGTIKPHSEIPVKAQLKLRESGLDEAVSVQAELQSSTGKHTLTALMEAKCPAPFAALPKRLEFLKMTEGLTRQQTFFLTCDGMGIKASDFSVDCTNPCITAKLETVSDGRIAVIVSVTPPSGKEEFNERLQVFCKTLEHSIIVPVVIDCTVLIQFSPAILRVSTKASESREGDNLFVWATDKSKTDEIAITPPKGISVQLAERLTNGRLRYRVTYDESYSPFENERIRISIKGEQLSTRYVTVMQQ